MARPTTAHLKRSGGGGLACHRVLRGGPGAGAQNPGYVGPKAYYLALGDSLAYGYQPNFNWSNGYAQQWYSNLKTHGTTSLTNYGCPSETTTTFINGGCPNAWLEHNHYSGSQLNAALNFLAKHRGQVSPVTLDLGASDLLGDINTSTCTVSNSWQTTLTTVNSNLVTILTDLVAALTVNGQLTGDLVIMNYYDPYAIKCPNSIPYVAPTYAKSLDADLAADAAQAKVTIPIVDAYDAIPTSKLCNDTWICSSYNDIHPNTTGYGVIASTFENASGY